MALSTAKDRVASPSLDPALLAHNVSVMSYQEFEQLPPLPEDCGELPAMWEDGGAVDSVREGYSVGGSFEEDPQWGSLSHDDGVKIFEDGASSQAEENSQPHHQHQQQQQQQQQHKSSLEQRSTLIEQTLSEIYASPFPQLMYADSQPASHTDQQQQQHSKPPRKTSFRTPDPDSNSNPELNPADCAPSHASLSPDSLSPRGTTGLLETTPAGRQESAAVWERGEEEGVEKREDREVVRLGLSPDAHKKVKASIARAAQKAVSGYRTCDDADSYVGAQVRPTLILARAPPSPSGILRRTNKKSAAKVTHGSVRWADGKAPSLPPTDGVTQEKQH